MNVPHWQMLPCDEAAAQALGSALLVPPLVARLLVQRGLTTFQSANSFLYPSLEALHHPFEMRDMDKAVDRLDDALRNGERILLFGDYDVDGTTSVALVYAFLSGFYQNLDYYLPDRDKEGYGVSLAGVEYARRTGATLVIALDCGIKAHEAIRLAKTYGIDFIVCDHHLPEGDLPEAVANLDPKRPDCPYPYKDLSGCGIAFKFAQALALHNHLPMEELEPLLDLVAFSVACDIVPMTGENRVLTHFGLQRLNSHPRTGLWALSQRIRRHFPLQVSDLVFALGPLVNAAGRLGDAREAVRLLLSVDRRSALDQAGKLVQRNQERREVDYALADAAKQRVLEEPIWENRQSIVLYDPTWHKGVIGIAASRLAEAFYRPTIILTKSEGRAVGSARSVQGFDLYTALQECEDLLFSFGGHAHAAGMQLPETNLDAFSERFEAIVRRDWSPEHRQPVIDINGPLNFHEITPELCSWLRRLAPFGPQNHSPVFWTTGVTDSGQSKPLPNNHVRIALRQQGFSGILHGIAFGLSDAFDALRKQPFDIAFSLRDELWQGHNTLSLQVKAIRPGTQAAAQSGEGRTGMPLPANPR